MKFVEWQNTYPDSFVKYPEMQSLSGEVQKCIAETLALLQDKNLLNDVSLEAILNLFSNYLSSTEISDMLQGLINHPHMTINNFIFICNHQESIDCINLFLKLDHQNFTFKEFKNKALINYQVISGMSTALYFFSLCDRNFSLNEFCVISKIMANPLCKAILESCTRTFSDYEENTPISALYANNLINQIVTERNQKKQIAIFYDALAVFRVNPSSQKYMFSIYADIDFHSALLSEPEELANIHRMIGHGINVENIIIKELKKLIHANIAEIKTFYDSKRVKNLVTTLLTNVIPFDALDQIIYKVAAEIEKNDYYSTRDYKHLMSEIREKAEHIVFPQNTFKDELESIPDIERPKRRFEIFKNDDRPNEQSNTANKNQQNFKI